MTNPPTSDAAGAVLPPIDHDADYDRYYIPMPGGWEVQTKGKGSTFRIANSITGERFAIIEQPYLFENLERMAREIHAAASTPQPPPKAGSAEDRKQWGYALERCIESQRRLAKGIDNDNPGDPWAALSVWEDVALLEAMHAAFFPAPAPKESK